jgi:outer membrane protein assembly factor BamB
VAQPGEPVKQDTTMNRRIPTALQWLQVAVIMGVATAAAGDWPHFRGPTQDGISTESGWQANWAGGAPTIAWERKLGIGAASVAVAGDRVVTLGNKANRDYVTCLAAVSGEVIWEVNYPCKFETRQFEGGPAATPTIADGRVFTLSHDGQLHCFSLADGSRIWRKMLRHDFGGKMPRWKYAGSPLVVDGKLIVDSGGTGASTLMLNAADGSKIWGAGDDGAGYACPVIAGTGEARQILMFKAKHLVALRFSDGTELWRIPWKTSYDVNASTPTVRGDRLFVSSGYKDGRAALFDISGAQPRELWRNDEMRTKMSSCVVIGDAAYGVSEKGRSLLCLNLADGSVRWRQKGFGANGTLIAADGKLIVLGDSGELAIGTPTAAGFNVLSRGKVLDKRCWVAPVLANGRIYCKNNVGRLVCVDVRGK